MKNEYLKLKDILFIIATLWVGLFVILLVGAGAAKLGEILSGLLLNAQQWLEQTAKDQPILTAFIVCGIAAVTIGIIIAGAEALSRIRAWVYEKTDSK